MNLPSVRGQGDVIVGLGTSFHEVAGVIQFPELQRETRHHKHLRWSKVLQKPQLKPVKTTHAPPSLSTNAIRLLTYHRQ